MSKRLGWLRRWPVLAGLLGRTGTPGDAASPFIDTRDYWNRRYASGGTSGAGSYGKFAEFKARVLNRLFDEHGIASVIEFGCGDGNQLRLLNVPQYLGVDISAQAVARCREAFAGHGGRHFEVLDRYDGEQADCALSLDVVFHLVEDDLFDDYMKRLFAAATRLVVVYSSNHEAEDRSEGVHVRHREFTRWVGTHATGWTLAHHIPNEYPYRGDWREGSFADFYVFVPARS